MSSISITSSQQRYKKYCPRCIYLYTYSDFNAIYDFYYCPQHYSYNHPCLLRQYAEGLDAYYSIILNGKPTHCEKDILNCYCIATRIAKEMKLITKCEIDMIYMVDIT